MGLIGTDMVIFRVRNWKSGLKW